MVLQAFNRFNSSTSDFVSTFSRPISRFTHLYTGQILCQCQLTVEAFVMNSCRWRAIVFDDFFSSLSMMNSCCWCVIVCDDFMLLICNGQWWIHVVDASLSAVSVMMSCHWYMIVNDEFISFMCHCQWWICVVNIYLSMMNSSHWCTIVCDDVMSLICDRQWWIYKDRSDRFTFFVGATHCSLLGSHTPLLSSRLHI